MHYPHKQDPKDKVDNSPSSKPVRLNEKDSGAANGGKSVSHPGFIDNHDDKPAMPRRAPR
jgi:hypothetical protein